MPYVHGNEYILQIHREFGCYFQTGKAKVKGELVDVPADLAESRNRIATSGALWGLRRHFLGWANSQEMIIRKDDFEVMMLGFGAYEVQRW